MSTLETRGYGVHGRIIRVLAVFALYLSGGAAGEIAVQLVYRESARTPSYVCSFCSAAIPYRSSSRVRITTTENYELRFGIATMNTSVI